jgi:diguanylate cyclase (GGDEF)-like protein
MRMQRDWRQIVVRSPLALTVTAVAAASVMLSVAALFALTAALGLGFDGDFPIYVGLAVIIPLLVSVPVSWFIVRLLREVDEARQAAQKLAWQDELTGLFNRRRFTELAQRELDLARRSGRTVMAVLMDLDDFKLINDRHGHAVGDRMLSAVARATGATLRSTDLAARWGGEEFAIVLPGTPVADGFEVLERLLQAVRSLRVLTADGVSMHCTASIGVAMSGADIDRFESLIDRADQAMYRAKMAGKNRVVLADTANGAGFAAPLFVEAEVDPETENGLAPCES